uniref:Tyrosine-protein kinase n=1 Tax=Parascaris univalens TaxID=6257 RepID=A0A915AHS5_PARUN
MRESNTPTSYRCGTTHSGNEFTSLVRWSGILDPIAAARLLLGKTDDSARYVEDNLLVSECQKVKASEMHDGLSDRECFEWLPAAIGRTATFVENSRGAVDSWKGLSKHIRTMTAAHFFPKQAPHIVVDAKHCKNISILALQLAVGRLGSEQFRFPGYIQRKKWPRIRFQPKNELGCEVETATEDVLSALDLIISDGNGLQQATPVVIFYSLNYVGREDEAGVVLTSWWPN